MRISELPSPGIVNLWQAAISFAESESAGHVKIKAMLSYRHRPHILYSAKGRTGSSRYRVYPIYKKNLSISSPFTDAENFAPCPVCHQELWWTKADGLEGQFCGDPQKPCYVFSGDEFTFSLSPGCVEEIAQYRHPNTISQRILDI